MLSTSGLAIRAFSPLYETFNEKLDQMLSSGLVQKFLKEIMSRRKDIEDDIGPQVLTLEDLGVAFQVCCIPLILSVIAFFGEIAVFCWKRWWPKLKMKITVPFVVVAFFER